MRIRGEKLGIVGLGNVGTAVALRAKVFGFDVLYYDPRIADGRGKALGITKVNSLQELLYGSDCVSLHCSLNDQTKLMFNDYAFNKMRKVPLSKNQYKFVQGIPSNRKQRRTIA